MRRLLIVAASAAVLGLGACASTGADTPAPTTAAAPAPTPAPAPAPAAAPAPSPAIAAGQGVFQARCSGCHRAGGAAPSREALRGRSHGDIVTALTTGKMMAQGRALSDEDKSNVATFLTQGPA
jgi:mono/diheme cytochrome c family protein